MSLAQFEAEGSSYPLDDEGENLSGGKSFRFSRRGMAAIAARTKYWRDDHTLRIYKNTLRLMEDSK